MAEYSDSKVSDREIRLSAEVGRFGCHALLLVAENRGLSVWKSAPLMSIQLSSESRKLHSSDE
jgi:hypothetical protein